ncbi:DNA primase [Mesosutterella sp. OilRF-GAM-744-9]|uniref:DNA primase n=1 Tax=Mesosutterella porci TaxID=2915351 RepID=A0ABS9MT40_9BURK|nr:DNA primase [Mesosutterella sp. oilRF-744-WT-GAM-9]MCG5031779.1 DNA primase [Mesosutterella sp. oilRF-744-WT-GAM-9]
MIPESFIKDLLDRVDIVDVVSRFVTLKKKGINWFGLCPFHHEKTGSFSVNQSKQFYKCFGCGAHGNAIGFLMQYKGISYPEAIRELAAEVGMQVPEEPGSRRRREKTESLTELMDRARGFYALELRKSPAALAYLQGRQISEATQAKFSLGYSPDSWQALEALFGAHYGDKALEACGLVISKDGHRYDRFRGRVMFPIRNPRGQVIGFGARVMGQGEPKYLNSPETDIFRKGQEVYGLWEGREAIRKAGRAIVCEGYMDVIQLSQAGFGEAVAALGTAIGQAHIRKLFKIVPRIYFSFDGDAAGRHAARRALEQVLPVIEDTLEARFVLLPPEHDPDSLIKAEGPQAYERELEHSFPLSAFLVNSLKEGKAMGSPEGRAQFVSEAKPLLASLTHAPMLRRQLLGSLAMEVQMAPQELAALIGIPTLVAAEPRQVSREGWAAGRAAAAPPSGFGRSAAGRRQGAVPVPDLREKMLRCLLAWPELGREFSGQMEDWVAGGGTELDRRLLEVWRACCGTEEDAPQTSGALLNALRDSPNLELYQSLLDRELEVETTLEQARGSLNLAFLKIAEGELKQRCQEVGKKEPFDEELYKSLEKRLAEVSREIREAGSGEGAARREPSAGI